MQLEVDGDRPPPASRADGAHPRHGVEALREAVESGGIMTLHAYLIQYLAMWSLATRAFYQDNSRPRGRSSGQLGFGSGQCVLCLSVSVLGDLGVARHRGRSLRTTRSHGGVNSGQLDLVLSQCVLCVRSGACPHSDLFLMEALPLGLISLW